MGVVFSEVFVGVVGMAEGYEMTRDLRGLLGNEMLSPTSVRIVSREASGMIDKKRRRLERSGMKGGSGDVGEGVLSGGDDDVRIWNKCDLGGVSLEGEGFGIWESKGPSSILADDALRLLLMSRGLSGTSSSNLTCSCPHTSELKDSNCSGCAL